MYFHFLVLCCLLPILFLLPKKSVPPKKSDVNKAKKLPLNGQTASASFEVKEKESKKVMSVLKR